MSDENLYRIKRNSTQYGDLDFQPALPNDQLMGKIMNNKLLMSTLGAEEVMKKCIDMEWKWFERRCMRCGDLPEMRELQKELREHIKREKKWIAKGAKANAV